MVHGPCWPCGTWGSQCTAPCPSFFHVLHGRSPGCLGGAEQGGGFQSHNCPWKILLGADVHFMAAAGNGVGGGGGRRGCGNLKGRGLLQGPVET